MIVRHLRQKSSDRVLEWFRPILARLAQPGRPESLVGGDFLQPVLPVYLARAPARLDVMGGIADYSGAVVLQLPLRRSTFAALQPIPSPRLEIATLRAGSLDRFELEMEQLLDGELRSAETLAAWFAARDGDRWAAYVVGLVQLCLHHRDRLPGAGLAGFRLLLVSEVPEAKGVSSSAALEVAAMSVLAFHFGVPIDPERLAERCQWVENHVVGAPCGIMDQMTSVLGRQDRLLRLRCQPAVVEGTLPVPRGYRFFGIDSGVRHAVSGADYGTVRAAAFMGYRIVADAAGLAVRAVGDSVTIDDPLWGGYLANVTPDELRERFLERLPVRMTGREFLRNYHGTTDPVTRVDPDREYPVRDATAHPVYEQDRVERFASLLGRLPGEPAAAWEMGRLMYESHDSYGRCGLGSAATDRLVELVRSADPAHGLFGAKITGGGSGGTVAVFATEDAAPRVRDLAARYTRESGRAAEVFSRSGPGAAETGVLVVDAPIPSGGWA